MALARRLSKYAESDGLVLAVPRGGLPVAYAIAKRLKLPMDIILTKKIGHPNNREYAIGAVSLTEQYVLPHEEVPQHYIDHEVLRIRESLKATYQKLKGNAPASDVRDKVVLVVDDGVATGNTMLVTLRMLRQGKPRKIIAAVPVASRQAEAKLQAEADEWVCLYVPPYFTGVGAYYEDFEQVTDEEARMYLEMAQSAGADEPKR